MRRKQFDPQKPLNHSQLQGLWGAAFPARKGTLTKIAPLIKCSSQSGTPGHGFVAQVWGPDGNSIAMVDMTDDPSVATARAELAAYAMTNVIEMQDELEHLRAEVIRLRARDVHVSKMAQALSDAQTAVNKVKPTLLRRIIGLGR